MGALLTRRRKKRHRGNTVEEGPGDCDETKKHFEDDSSLTDTISRPPSASSFRSGCTSLHSHSARHHYRSKRSSMGSDDLQSDVPTISETIADMRDLEELGISRSADQLSMSPTSSLIGGSRGVGSFGISNPSPAITMIDMRQHPLAPINICTHGTSSSLDSHMSNSAAIGDLGCCSDVPSVRDDMSVASAHSEICVSFPASLAPSVCESEATTVESPRHRTRGVNGRSTSFKNMSQLRITRSRAGTDYGTGTSSSSDSLLREADSRAGCQHIGVSRGGPGRPRRAPSSGTVSSGSHREQPLQQQQQQQQQQRGGAQLAGC